MADNKPAPEVDVTKEWRATQGQKSAATRLRLFAAMLGHRHRHRNRRDRHAPPAQVRPRQPAAADRPPGRDRRVRDRRQPDVEGGQQARPGAQSDAARFFFQNQLGAIITVIAFLPLIVLIFMDKDMDPKNKKIAGGIGVVLAVGRDADRRDFNPPSVEQYTQDMNKCAAQIKASQPTTACSPEVAAQAKDIARDSARWPTRQRTRASQRPGCRLLDRSGERRQEVCHAARLPHLPGREPVRGKTVNHGSVTEAYAENATRITKQIPMEQKQCGFFRQFGVGRRQT